MERTAGRKSRPPTRHAALETKAAALESHAAQATADHARLLTMKAQVARLLEGSAAPAGAQVRQ